MLLHPGHHRPEKLGRGEAAVIVTVAFLWALLFLTLYLILEKGQ